MSEPFIAEIRMFGFNFAPRGWAELDGQILPISQNQSLYSLIGTTYGGDGVTTFALPDLRSRTPLHRDNAHREGQKGGIEEVTLTTAQLPVHDHGVRASGEGANAGTPTNHLLAAESAPEAAYAPSASSGHVALRDGTIANVGGGQAHNNMQPYETLNFCIALQGLFPSRS